MKFFFDKYEFTSGGALGSLTLGLVVKELWRRRLPGLLASKVRTPHQWGLDRDDHRSLPPMLPLGARSMPGHHATSSLHWVSAHGHGHVCRANQPEVVAANRVAPALQVDEPLENIRVAEKHVRFLWRWILMPLLFCLIGTIINFNQLPKSTILKAVGLIFAGACPRRVICMRFSSTHTYSSLLSTASFRLAMCRLCHCINFAQCFCKTGLAGDVSPTVPSFGGCAGLAVRMSTTFVVMQCGYTPLEAVWFAIAWIPKVRALIPPTCWDHNHTRGLILPFWDHNHSHGLILPFVFVALPSLFCARGLSWTFLVYNSAVATKRQCVRSLLLLWVVKGFFTGRSLCRRQCKLRLRRCHWRRSTRRIQWAAQSTPSTMRGQQMP